MNQIPTHNLSHQDIEQNAANLFLWDTIKGRNFSESHAHSFNEIIFFIKGGGFHVMSHEKHEIVDYSFHILPAHYIHRLERLETAEGFTIAFSNLFIHQLKNFDKKTNYSTLISVPLTINLTQEDFEDFAISFQELKVNQNRASVFLNLVAIIFIKLLDRINLNSNKLSSTSFEMQCITLLNKHFTERRKTDFYANQMNLSSQTFSKRVKTLFGKSIMDLQNERLIDYAKILLKSDEMTVGQIAFSLGFKDEAHFCNFFKSHTSLTPNSFRSLSKTAIDI